MQVYENRCMKCICVAGLRGRTIGIDRALANLNISNMTLNLIYTFKFRALREESQEFIPIQSTYRLHCLLDVINH